MRCPKCNQAAISFFDWAKGMRWYKTECDACGHKLRANAATSVGFGLTVAVGLVVAILCNRHFEWANHLVTFLIGFVMVIVGAVITWFGGGGYVPADDADSGR
ncbi:MAG: hypothetical protein HQ567_12850 [Candidatus Nealsonbacteria bacterium]|nr:hypothetical protein [Candidatus Nealsonbacteria bacterium]